MYTESIVRNEENLHTSCKLEEEGGKMYPFAIADPRFLEGQAMIDLFLMLLHLYFCQIFTSDLFLGNIGFLSPKYMKSKLEFLAADFMFYLNLVD